MDNEKNKSVRIRTQVGIDSKLDVYLQRDVDLMQILSLSLKQSDAYLNKSSNYGVIVGRVLANDAFGVENVKVSVFIPISDEYYIKRIRSIYPFRNVTNRNSINNTRYNLLEDYVDDECHADIGTFPNKRLLLDDNTYIEVFEKYYKFTTSTNKSGDYMIYGVPIGNQQVHIDVDLSNIGLLSQRPRDFYYKGYGQELFKNANQFKTSTNLDNLAQVLSQNKSVSVYPFWGDEENDTIAITRCDINLDYKFESTCVFMGSAITDSGTNAIGSNCLPSKKVGKNSELISGEGIIEMIRKTQDGYVEEFSIKGGRLIDSDGVWCYQIPMNLDYVQTDEEGNLIPSENPNKGIATRARVRFRFSLDDIDGDGKSRHRAEYLVPNNPIVAQEDVSDRDVNKIHKGLKFDGTDFERHYDFGSSTQESDFRDLLWNNVYSVKSYIPRIVNGASRKHFLPKLRESKREFLGIKSVNHSDNNNPFPYNSFMGDLPLTFRLICNLFDMIVAVLRAINKVLSIIHNINIPVIRKLTRKVQCIGMEIGDLLAFPGCNGRAEKDFNCKGMKCSSSEDEIDQYVQDKLAEDFDAIDLDFGNDWVNGTLYFPLWHWLKKKKKRFFFGLFSRKAVDRYCSCEKGSRNSYIYHYMHAYDSVVKTNKQTGSETITQVDMPLGLIHKHLNKDDIELYYYPSAILKPNKEMFRLFATDIILLGSLVDNDINGVGKLFSYLPQTTAHIPPLVQEREIDKTHPTSFVDVANGVEMPYDALLVSGMDEGNRGEGDGLFFGLTCNKLYPNSQGSINAIRACELGVDLDTTHYYPNATNGNLSYKLSRADALVSKVEMYNADIRAEFATYNNQPLIVSKLNKLTGYKTYDYKYMYPQDFDSCLIGKKNVTNEKFSQSYLDFRYGKAKHFQDSLVEGSNKNPFVGPIYENSFYFYFGLKEGKTAIDKFRNLFYVACVKDAELGFDIGVDIESLGSTCRREDNPKDFPKLTLDLSSASKPYELYIKDLDGDVKFRLSNANKDTIPLFKVFSVDDSYGELKEGGSGIEPIVYKVYVKDNNGKVSTQKIDLEIPNIMVGTNADNFKKRYEEVIDNSDKGRFTIDKISLDGEEMSVSTSDISIVNVDFNNLYIKTEDGEDELFDKDGVYKYKVGLRIKGNTFIAYSDNESYNDNLSFDSGYFYTDIPQSVTLNIALLCGDYVLEDYQGMVGAEISDFEPYKLTLNGFAITEWVGYTKKNGVNKLLDEPKMFYPINYKMNQDTQVSSYNYKYWNDVINGYNEMDDNFQKKIAVASYKFGSLFNMCDILYVTKDNNKNTNVGYDCQSVESEDYQGFVFYPSGCDDSQQLDGKIDNFIYQQRNYYNVDANAPLYVSYYVRDAGFETTLFYYAIEGSSVSIESMTLDIGSRSLLHKKTDYVKNRLYKDSGRKFGFYDCFVRNIDDKGNVIKGAVEPNGAKFTSLSVNNWFSHDSYDCRLNAVLFGFQDNKTTELKGTLYGGLYLKTQKVVDEESNELVDTHNVISTDDTTSYSYNGEIIKYNAFGDKDLTLYDMKFGEDGYAVSLGNNLTNRPLLDVKSANVRTITATTNSENKGMVEFELTNNSFEVDLMVDDDDNIVGLVNEGNKVSFNIPSLTVYNEDNLIESNYSLDWGDLTSKFLQNQYNSHCNIKLSNGNVVSKLVRVKSAMEDESSKFAMIVNGSVTLDAIKALVANVVGNEKKLDKILTMPNIVNKSCSYSVDSVIVDAIALPNGNSLKLFDVGMCDMDESECYLKIENWDNINISQDKLLLIRRHYNDNWRETHLDHIAYIVSLTPLKDICKTVQENPWEKVVGTTIYKKSGYEYSYLKNDFSFEVIESGDSFDITKITDKVDKIGNVVIAENTDTNEKVTIKID